METFHKRKKQHKEYGFKSYYVVWKLGVPSPMIYSIFSFKSYYVVWKLFGFFITNLESAEFKSYYVVWKRHSRYLIFWGLLEV